MNAIADRLKTWRQDEKLSRNDAAKLIGCSPMSLQNWEGGKSNPRATYMTRIEHALQGKPIPLAYQRNATVTRPIGSLISGKGLELSVRYLNCEFPWPRPPTTPEYASLHTVHSHLHAAASTALMEGRLAIAEAFIFAMEELIPKAEKLMPPCPHCLKPIYERTEKISAQDIAALVESAELTGTDGDGI